MKRLNALKVHKNVLKGFEEEGKLGKSELCRIFCCCTETDQTQSQKTTDCGIG